MRNVQIYFVLECPEEYCCNKPSLLKWRADMTHLTHCLVFLKYPYFSAENISACSPGSDQVQKVLPALVDFAEFLLDLSSFALLAGPCQTLPHRLQLLLVFLCYINLFLILLGERHQTAHSRLIPCLVCMCEMTKDVIVLFFFGWKLYILLNCAHPTQLFHHLFNADISILWDLTFHLCEPLTQLLVLLVKHCPFVQLFAHLLPTQGQLMGGKWKKKQVTDWHQHNISLLVVSDGQWKVWIYLVADLSPLTL